MHDKLFKQSNCRGGVGEGEGWSFDFVPQPHFVLAFEWSKPCFEGYSDCERADYGKIKWNLHVSFMSEYLWNLLFVNIWKLMKHLCFYVSTPAPMRDSRIGMDEFAMWKEKNREAEKYRKKLNQTFYSRAVMYFVAVFVNFHNCSVLFSELKLFVLKLSSALLIRINGKSCTSAEFNCSRFNSTASMYS